PRPKKNPSRRRQTATPPSPGRHTPRTAGRAPPASPSRSTSPATVGVSNRLRIDTSTSRLERMRLIRRVASSEWPPSAKKSSSIPTRSNPKTSANKAHSNSSRGLRAKRNTEALTSGAGSAPRSNFPFAVSGRCSKTTTRGRHHAGGRGDPNCRPHPPPNTLPPTRKNNIPKKRRPPRPTRARTHTRLRHAVMPQQRCLDLPGLNAEAADLNLLVRSPHKLQNPIPAPARQVPAAVHPAPRSAKPIRNKALTRQPAAPNIPTTNPSTRNVKLPNYPNRHRLQTTVQYINPQIGDAAPDEVAAGREGKVSVKQNMTDMHRRLGDAVHVDQHRGTVEVML